MATTKKIILLFMTAFLIIVSSVKVFAGSSDLLDKILALITVLVFFTEQVSR